MKEDYIDPQIYELYDEYCHTEMTRRKFLNKASALVVVSGSAIAMAEALLPQYAKAQMVSFTDERIKATYVDYDSPGGNSGKMSGYLVQPAGEGPFPTVLIVHENRGLNPHIEDVARRFAKEGYVALAIDLLAREGGTATHDRRLVPGKLVLAQQHQDVGAPAVEQDQDADRRRCLLRQPVRAAAAVSWRAPLHPSLPGPPSPHPAAPRSPHPALRPSAS